MTEEVRIVGNTAAFFDIDGTLYREGFIADLFKKFIRSEIIEEETWYKEVKPEFVKWDRRIGTYDTYLDKIATIYTQAIKGYHKSFIEHIVKKVVNEKGARAYVFTRERIKWHKEQGHKIITISGSPVELVREMAELYGFDDYMGSYYVIGEDDTYTGEVVPMWDSRSKNVAVLHMRDKYDLDLDKCYAYGDTAGDFAMMRLVGHPILVNPTRELINLVTECEDIRRRAKITVERKDVIYNIPFDTLNIIEKDIIYDVPVIPEEGLIPDK